MKYPVCLYFVELFFIYIYEILFCNYFSCAVLSWFWCKHNAGLMEWFRKCFCLSYWRSLRSNSAFLNFYYYYWNVIALQYWAGFCSATVWTSHKYTYVPSILSFSPTRISTPPRYQRAPGWAPSIIQQEKYQF